MERNKIKILLFCLCALCNIFQISSQTESDTERLKIGGIALNAEKLIVLKKAVSGIYYQYNHTIKMEEGLQKKSDTLFLATGATQSVFVDPTYKEELEIQRKARIARSKKTKMVNPQHENLNDIAELINVNSDYKEDDPGHPVQIYKKRNTGVVSSVYNTYVENIRCD